MGVPDLLRRFVLVLPAVCALATISYVVYTNSSPQGNWSAIARADTTKDFSILCDSCRNGTEDDRTVDEADEAVVKHQYKHRIVLRNPRPSCLNVSFAPSPDLPSTALASYPGSGNTWTRHLIELITGERDEASNIIHKKIWLKVILIILLSKSMKSRCMLFLVIPKL